MEETFVQVGCAMIPILGQVINVNMSGIRLTGDEHIAKTCRETIRGNNIYGLNTSFYNGESKYSILIKGGTREPFLYKNGKHVYMIVLRENHVITAMKLDEYVFHSQNINNHISQEFAREMRKAFVKK